MVKQLKLQKHQKNLPQIAGYSVGKNLIISMLGVPILLGERNEYVCGGCLLLLNHLGVRCLLHSRLTVLPMTSYTPHNVLLRSVDGCEMSFLIPTFSLFPSFLPVVDFTSTVCYLDCRKIGVISTHARVNIPRGFVSLSDVNDTKDFSKNFGKLVSLISNKRTGLTDWQVISQNTLPMQLIIPSLLQ